MRGQDAPGPGAPTHPVWVYNMPANPDVQIRDKTEAFSMHIREMRVAGPLFAVGQRTANPDQERIGNVVRVSRVGRSARL